MKLPEYVAKLPHEDRSRYEHVYNMAASQAGPEVGTIAANNWLQRQVQAKTLVAYTRPKVERVVFTLEKGPELIKRTEDGEDYVSFKLASVGKDKKGKTWTKKVLEKWANLINDGKTLLGDVDHEYYDKVTQHQFLTESEIKERLAEKPSIAKGIQAMFNDGVLWVRAMIDKRYRKTIEKAQGVSLEALVETDNNGTVLDGDLLGFTFGVKDQPVFDDTGVTFHDRPTTA